VIAGPTPATHPAEYHLEHPMKSSTAIATQEPTIVVDELVMNDGVYGRTELARIRISPDNRKRFNPQKLQELADSIKAVGVAQPILIRPVNPTELEPQDFEIVAGERRYRASIIAGMADIPAMVRILTDVQAAKLRILENLQREDPHPIEEAEGFQIMMMQHGYSADQLAAEINKSRAYVYARLKLCALAIEVREQVLDGKVDASTALLVARIPVPALQVRAMAEILEGYRNQPMSYREAAAFTQERYMLDLNKAEFDRADAKLLATAGACSKCPKRSGNQPEVFADISADVCTDPDCFKEKKAAHIDRIIDVSGKKGVPTFDSEDALRAHDPVSLLVRSDGYLNYMERFVAYSDSYKPIISKLNAANTPPVKAYLHVSGKLIPVFERAAVQTALEEVGVCATAVQLKEEAARSNETAPNAKRLAQMKAEAESLRRREATAERETSFRVSLYKQFRERAKTGLSLLSLRQFVKLVLVDDNTYALPDDLLDVYGLASYSDEAVAAHIDQATLPEVQLILIDLVLGNCLGIDSNQVEEDGTIDDDDFDNGVMRIATLNAMASHEGIDLVAIREQFDLAALALEDVDERYMHRFIRGYPERINELTKSITESRPYLLGSLELAAKDCGFVYIGHSTWSTSSPSTTTPHVEDGAAVVCDGEDLEAAMAEPVPTKKPSKVKPAAKKISVPAAETEPAAVSKTVLTPAASWPFPKSRDGVRDPVAADK
jgi:ParB/RepB/Spo0J family partition protein